MLIKKEDGTEDSLKSKLQDVKQREHEHFNPQNNGIFSQILPRGHTSLALGEH